MRIKTGMKVYRAKLIYNGNCALCNKITSKVITKNPHGKTQAFLCTKCYNGIVKIKYKEKD